MANYYEEFRKNPRKIEELKLRLSAHRTIVINAYKKIYFFAFLTFFVWIIFDAGLCLAVYKNYGILVSFPIIITFQLSIIIAYYIFIRIYYEIRRKANFDIKTMFDDSVLQNLYNGIWTEIKKEKQISLSLEGLVLNNVSGIKKYLSVSEYSIKEGGKFNEKIRTLNSISFNGDFWNIAYYTIDKKARFDVFLYPFIKGHTILANKGYRSKRKEKTKIKFNKATFINFKFANPVKWTALKNSFSKDDLKYLEMRGIYVTVGDYDINFCFIEREKARYRPGISIFVGLGKYLKLNLQDDIDIEKVLDTIYDKAMYDMSNFLSKYILINWFVQKYRLKESDGRYYIIDLIKNELLNKKND